MTEEQIERLTAIGDRAQKDIDLFERFDASVAIQCGEDGSRMLGHLRGTVESCNDLIEKARARPTETAG